MKKLILLFFLCPFILYSHSMRCEVDIHLNFTIDPNILLLHILQYDPIFIPTGPMRQDLLNLHEDMLMNSTEEYFYLRDMRRKKRSYTFEDPSILLLLERAKNSPFFSTLLYQTEKYLDFCFEQWEKNYPRVKAYLEDVIRIPMQREFTVFITHPGLRCGYYQKGFSIFWGGEELFENYTTIYLTHEILHSYLPFGDLPHAIQELATDSELRYQLSNVSYPPFIGHPFTLTWKEKILEDWYAYLKEDDEDLIQFIERIKKNISYQGFYEINEEFDRESSSFE